MRVHHLNCATLRPPSRRLVNGTGGLFDKATMVCHCLLVETDAGLVLIDSGFGTADLAAPVESLGRRFVRGIRPVLDPSETAIAQVRRLGYRPEDVRHIILTHLDLDHAGGISDFPWATVHLHATEHDAGLNPTRAERFRYRPNHWAHGPQWATYRPTGEPWFGFESVRDLTGLPPQFLLVPLPGHTRGHTGVAVDTGSGWLLHAGDAYFHHRESDPHDPKSTALLSLFQKMMQVDGPARLANQERLRQLRAGHDDQVTVFCAHDAVEFERDAVLAVP